MAHHRLARSFVPVIALVAVSACGGSDDDTASSDTASTTIAGDAAAGAPPTAPPAASPDEPAQPGEPDEPAQPGESGAPTGTITGNGETWNVAGSFQAGGEFLICEGDNPAFPGDANIIVRLDADREFSFLVSDGVPSAGFGDSLFREEATEVSFEREGTTIIGQATFPDTGTVDFTLTCS